jgi:hypothetical protein
MQPPPPPGGLLCSQLVGGGGSALITGVLAAGVCMHNVRVSGLTLQ